MTNYLISKTFNLSITSAFSVDIAITEVNLIKYVIRDSEIVKAGSVIEEVVRIRHYRCLSSLITSYKVRVIPYCFHSIEILMKYTDLSTVTAADEEPYNLTAVCVYIVIDLNIEACQLIMAI
jgi:hypothetical protein